MFCEAYCDDTIAELITMVLYNFLNTSLELSVFRTNTWSAVLPAHDIYPVDQRIPYPLLTRWVH
jgi:hypothetical protein